PLTVTRGFLQMLKDPSIPEDKRQFYLDTAIDELDRAEVIISEYLRFSKPHHDQTSTLTWKYEIEKALELLLPYANHFSVKVKHQLEDGLYVNGEASKFQHCLLNIMKNCIEAMPNGVDCLIESHRSEDKFSISIKDTGIGMSAREIAMIGEPYYSTKKEKGTGLGMMVVFNILNEMGGSLD
ncbi:HAMP domain-containing sensor histidine kinase, partial [Enterococcus faecium]|uniref:HAMP domain-containing sensor histidine kinase n=1 Tax=Enterococcus faecium TaxID=1352 RepID=UPI0030C7E5B1